MATPCSARPGGERRALPARAALAIAVLAMMLAINSVGGDNAGKEMVNNNILASDTWAFYQAKNIRQTSFRLATDQLELLLGTVPAEQQAEAQKKIASYKATAAQYESEPLHRGL